MIAVDIAVAGISVVGSNLGSASRFWTSLIDAHQLDHLPDPEPGGRSPQVRAVLGALEDSGAIEHLDEIPLYSLGDSFSDPLRAELQEACRPVKLLFRDDSKGSDSSGLAAALAALQAGECRHALVLAYAGSTGVALLLAELGSMKPEHNRVYARIRGLAECSDQSTQAASLYQALALAPRSVSYLLVPKLGEIQPDTATCIGSLYQDQAPAYTLPVGTPGLAADSAGAGLLAALAQSALALSNKLIPGNPTDIRFNYPLTAPLYLAREHRPWFHQHTEPRIAAVHDQASGYHLVLEEVRENSPLARAFELPFAWEAELAIFSARDRGAMIARLEQFINQLDSRGTADPAPIDIAMALNREADPDLTFRLAIVFRNMRNLRQLARQALDQLREDSAPKPNTPVYYGKVDPSHPPKLACIFPGLGFPGLVGRYTDNLFQLSLRIPEIRRTFDLVEQRGTEGDPYPTSHLYFPTDGYDSAQATILKNRLASPKHSEAENYGIPDRKNLSSFCVALSNWASWMVVQALEIPVAMTFGQSLGELTALCVAGKFDFRQLAPIYWKTEVDPDYFTNGGALVAVSASAERIEPLIADYPTVVIAVHISPAFQLLGGKREEIEVCIENLKKESIWTQVLPYPAIHTPFFSALRVSMEPTIKTIPVYPSSLDVYSGMTSAVYPDDPEAVRSIMLDNLDHPVHLWQVTRKMYQDGARVMLQAGGGATMYSQARTNIGADDVTAVSIDVDYRGPIEQINHMCAALFAAGITPDLAWLYRYRHGQPERWIQQQAEARQQAVEGMQPRDEAGAEALHSAAAASEPVAQSKLPFAGEIQAYTRDQSLQVIYTLDLARDLHLADHAFVTAQGVKPLAECLTVLPMTVSLEIMAQTAAHLARGYGLVGYRDISATNWIALRDTDRLELRIDAEIRSRDPDTDRIEIMVSIMSEGRSRPDISGIVILSTAYHETMRLELHELENPRPYPRSAEEIYADRTLFHGPLFQCISGNTWLGDNGIAGELVVNDRLGMFSDNPDPVLLSDPLLLDAVGQLIGLWAMEYGEYVYPISMGQIEIYAPTPPVGTRVPVIMNISKGGLKTLYADIEIQDGNGNLWMRINQWGDWAFKWPRPCVNYTRNPTRQLFATALEIAVAGNVSACIAENVRMDTSMLEIMARTTLTSAELEHYNRLAEYPHRQKQWLLGRVSAKDAVRSWLGDSTDYLHPASITIEPEASGRPIVRLPEGYPAPHISISHTDKYTVAIAGDLPVGIDIEAIASRDQSFVDAVSTADERRLIEQINQDLSQAVTLLWSAKESAGKLAGTGLPDNPKQIQLEGMDTDGLLCMHHLPLDTQIRVNSWLSDNHYITVALSAPA